MTTRISISIRYGFNIHLVTQRKHVAQLSDNNQLSMII